MPLIQTDQKWVGSDQNRSAPPTKHTVNARELIHPLVVVRSELRRAASAPVAVAPRSADAVAVAVASRPESFDPMYLTRGTNPSACLLLCRSFLDGVWICRSLLRLSLRAVMRQTNLHASSSHLRDDAAAKTRTLSHGHDADTPLPTPDSPLRSMIAPAALAACTVGIPGTGRNFSHLL